jgi:hypothetical protein
MPDDKSKTRPQDALRVNVHEAYEIEYWTKKFGCTAEQLKAAVKRVGVLARDVEGRSEAEIARNTTGAIRGIVTVAFDDGIPYEPDPDYSDSADPLWWRRWLLLGRSCSRRRHWRRAGADPYRLAVVRQAVDE